jgi:small-conductance mechanosensitive channel
MKQEVRIYTKYFTRLTTIVGICVLTFISILHVPASAQSLVSTKDLNEKAEVIKIKQETQETLAQTVTDLEKENAGLEADIISVQAAITQLEASIKGSPFTAEQIQSNTLQREALQKELEQKKGTITKNKETIAETRTKLDTTKTELNKEVTSFQSAIMAFLIGISRYIGIIIAIWILFIMLRWCVDRIVPNEVIRNTIVILAVFTAIFATFITIFFAFAGDTTYLAPSVGLLSAAIVVALQDFIASFFSWVIIKARGPFKLQDTIEIPTPSGLMVGVVTQIGFFRTRIREHIGGDTPDKEQSTGKTIFFPNNLILKQGFRNYTFDNKILWHKMRLTITFESDFDKARKAIDTIIHNEFHYMVDHKDIYLDDVHNLKNVYKPRIYLSISDYGPQFTIWIPSRSGVFRELQEKFSLSVLKAFKEHNVELAYPTTRIIRTESAEGYDVTGMHSSHPIA